MPPCGNFDQVEDEMGTGHPANHSTTEGRERKNTHTIYTIKGNPCNLREVEQQRLRCDQEAEISKISKPFYRLGPNRGRAMGPSVHRCEREGRIASHEIAQTWTEAGCRNNELVPPRFVSPPQSIADRLNMLDRINHFFDHHVAEARRNSHNGCRFEQ